MEVTSVLRNSLETGFIGRAHESYSPYQPQLVVNSKRANTKILSTILRELKTCESFIFSVAFLTTSGVAVLYNCLEDLAQRGVKGQVLVSQYQNFTQPDALVRLGQLPNIELRIVTEGDFHAKGYIFRHKDCYSLIVGSSNLTANALTRNKEWNLRVTALSGSRLSLKPWRPLSLNLTRRLLQMPILFRSIGRFIRPSATLHINRLVWWRG